MTSSLFCRKQSEITDVKVQTSKQD